MLTFCNFIPKLLTLFQGQNAILLPLHSEASKNKHLNYVFLDFALIFFQLVDVPWPLRKKERRRCSICVSTYMSKFVWTINHIIRKVDHNLIIFKALYIFLGKVVALDNTFSTGYKTLWFCYVKEFSQKTKTLSICMHLLYFLLGKIILRF